MERKLKKREVGIALKEPKTAEYNQGKEDLKTFGRLARTANTAAERKMWKAAEEEIERRQYALLKGEEPGPGMVSWDAIQGSMKKGGTVKKTGAYILHKGEKVIPAVGVSPAGKKNPLEDKKKKKDKKGKKN